MLTDARVDELLKQWLEGQRQGRVVSAEELCQDCPELLDELKRRLPTQSPPKSDPASTAKEWHKTAPGPLNASPDALDSARIPRVPTVILEEGAEAVPGYRLEKLLGRGGFGEVWKATGPGGIDAAVKCLRLGNAAKVESRSQELVQNLQHDHLPKHFGCWQSTEYLFIVMELADRSLFDRWKDCHKAGLPGIPWDELIGYMRETAEGIDHLNRQNIQHRDIKPQNLLLVGGHVKLADFGLAKEVAGSTATHTGTMSPAYAPTEFFEGKTSAHSDQYSLAITYCHLRGGEVPFEGTIAKITFGHLMKTPELKMLPEPERPPVLRALAKKPEERWPTCREFVAALAACGPPPEAKSERQEPAESTKLAEDSPPRVPEPPRAPLPPPPSAPAVLRKTDPPQAPDKLSSAKLVVPPSRLRLEQLEALATAPVVVRAPPKSGRTIARPGEFVNSLGMKFMLVPAGEFQMGAADNEADAAVDEKPRRLVRITKPFYLAIHEVTQELFLKFMGANPSKFHQDNAGGPKHPVEKVTWGEAVEFCRRLSQLADERRAGRSYRLPTEAEWEYACRAGSTTPFNYGSALSSLQANFNGNFPYGGAPKAPNLGRTTPVGCYRPNAFGLFDMHGNVWEWCADWYDAKYYTYAPTDDPQGPASGERRIVRGGSWFDYGMHCRSADRSPIPPDARYKNIGFRVAATV